MNTLNILFFLAGLAMAPLLFYDFYRLLAVFKQRNQIEKRLLQKRNQSGIFNRLYQATFEKKSAQMRINELLDDLTGKLDWKMLAYLDFLENEQALVFKSVRGLSQKYLDYVHEVFHDRIDVGSVASGRAISTKQPVVVNDWNKDPHLKGLTFLSRYGHVASFAAFPVISNLKTYGSLHVYGAKVGEFTLNEVQFFTTLTNSLAAIFEHDELYDKLKSEGR